MSCWHRVIDPCCFVALLRSNERFFVHSSNHADSFVVFPGANRRVEGMGSDYVYRVTLPRSKGGVQRD